MTDREHEIYERICELNHCMAALSEQMRPLRETLVDLSREFSKYSREKDKLERELVEVKVLPMYTGPRRVKPASAQLTAAALDAMSVDELQAMLEKVQNKLKRGGA